MVLFFSVFLLHAVTALSNEECVNQMKKNAVNLVACLQTDAVDKVCSAPESQVTAIGTKLNECFEKPEHAQKELQACLAELQKYSIAVQTCYKNATSKCEPMVQTLSNEVSTCLQQDNECVNNALTKQVKEVKNCLTIEAAKAICQSELDTLPNAVSECLKNATTQTRRAAISEALLQCSSDLNKLTQRVQKCFPHALKSCHAKVNTLTKEVEACLSNPHETKETTDKGQRLILGWIISINVLSVFIRPFLYL